MVRGRNAKPSTRSKAPPKAGAKATPPNEQDLVVFDTVVVACTTAAQAGCDGQAPVDALGLPTRFVRGPSFGTASSAANYQVPREYRISAGIRF